MATRNMLLLFLAAWGLVALAGCEAKRPSTYQGYVEGEFVYVAGKLAGRLDDLRVARGDTVAAGQVLYVLPVDGIWYEVQSNDTLNDIADEFKVKPEDIVNYPLNNLGGGANLLAGTKIVIPNGVKAAAATSVASSTSGGYAGYGSSAAVNPAASGNFMWPTQGTLTQYFGVYHSGIDIAYAVGIPIMAADGGYVSYAGWDNTGYGYEVLINHGNGFTTRYAHLSQYYVDAGQPVARGQVIAAMGSTGNSTGPHLHFEVIYGGVPQNPLFYLP
jgi:hypothetical protein